MQRLSKILAKAGIASRRKCEELIFEGKVKVNGKVTLIPQTMVDLDKDRIEIGGRKITAEEKKVAFLIHKPKGYLCSATRITPTSKLVTDLFSHLPYRLFTVGRLDRDTTGLLIVTNDGHLANKIMHPSFGITKEYVAKTYEEISPDHLAELSKGTFVDGVRVVPKKVIKVRRGTIKIIVGEGRKREVRILLERAGLRVLSLCRVRIGSLLLGNLPEGSFRELSEKEKGMFLESKEAIKASNLQS